MARAQTLDTSYRLSVAARAVAATVGGFILVSAFGIAVALILTRTGVMDRAAAVSLMTLTSWALWTALAMWAFHARDARQVWIWFTAASAGFAAIAYALTTL